MLAVNFIASTRTKYGTKTQLLDTIKTVQSKALQVYADVVFNHKDGGDGIETIWAQEVDWNEAIERLAISIKLMLGHLLLSPDVAINTQA